MTRFILIIIAGFIAYYFMSGSSGVEFPRNKMAATPNRELPNNKKIRVLLFTGTEWCPACKHLNAKVISTKEWDEFAQKELFFQVLDVPRDSSKTKESDRRKIEEYGVTGLPTMIVMDAQFNEISRKSGSGPPVENYKSWIRQHAKYY